MELWDGWDDFLKVIASDHKLTVEQKAVFLVRLSRQSIENKSKNQDIANDVIGGEADKALYAYNKRMKEVFDKLSQSFPEINSESRDKVDRTRTCLEKAYLKQQNQVKAEASSHTFASPDWQTICGQMLNSQKQQLRQQVTQIGCEVDVYVPLGLVERKHQSRRRDNYSLPPEQGSDFFQPTEEEIIQTYEHNEFLEKVIQQGKSKKSKGKRIAIIGEPGAGKTTTLEQIAFSTETPGFPIWISLKSLGKKSLEQYLRENWLKDALKTSDFTQQQKDLEELFKTGEVLLILDGVDEMPASSPVDALVKIKEELTGWVADARVVLTCRVNVWEASVNSLQGFDIYRTLEFSYGDGDKADQVKQFICEWFIKAEKPELGEPLREKLDEDRHQRIRDLVKNPLHLSLLCQSWYFKQGDLPETKAMLYEQFTRAFYEWKDEPFHTSVTERKKLNTALGLLAREAIDREKSIFAIRESFAVDVMGEELFNLACKLHWLNFVYKDADTGEKVYAFFHPTFQEYFAACTIDDWDYFLNHNNENPNPFQQDNNQACVYRIFEPQWKEVILLWIGRPKEEVPKEHKEEFIKALVEFEDGCDEFYLYSDKAISLVYDCFDEFRECNLNKVISLDEDGAVLRLDEVIPQHKQLYQSFCFNSFDKDLWGKGYRVNEAFLWRKTCQSELISVATDLEKLHDINDLIERLGYGQSVVTRWTSLKRLAEIASTNPTVITTLIERLYSRQDEEIYRAIAFLLAEVAPNNFNVVNALIHLLQTNLDNLTRKAAAESLFISARKNPFLTTIVSALKDYLRSNYNLYDCCYNVIWNCAESLSYPDFYQAWHSQPSLTHPEDPDNIQDSSSIVIQSLENQFIDIPSQLQPTDKTYPIVINTQSLKLETNTSAIAQKLCTKIYRQADYSEIPTVNNAAQLQQYIPRIQQQLQKQNLALILHNSEPKEQLIDLCYSLADSELGIYICLITKQLLEQPLKGFLPEQPNLISAIQSWIDEIG